MERQLYKEDDSELCGGLTREIYQALAVIRSSSGLVEQRVQHSAPELYQQMSWMFQNIDQSALQLGRIAENLQDALEMEKGSLRPRIEPVDLAWQYQQLLDMMEQGARAYGVTVCWQCSLAENAVFVYADSDWADKILLNLVSNAVLCSAAGQTVAIRLTHKPETLILEVQDQGGGLPVWAQDHLYEPFVTRYDRQGPAKTSGLGLYLTHAYCDSMGWQLALHPADGGTRAVVTIPQKSPPETMAPGGQLRSQPETLAAEIRKQRVQAELSVWRVHKTSVE